MVQVYYPPDCLSYTRIEHIFCGLCFDKNDFCMIFHIVKASKIQIIQKIQNKAWIFQKVNAKYHIVAPGILLELLERFERTPGMPADYETILI